MTTADDIDMAELRALIHESEERMAQYRDPVPEKNATWAQVSNRLGRRQLPEALVMAVLSGQMDDPNEIASGLTDAWCSAEWPLGAADAEVWVNMFERATTGFLNEGEPTPRSKLPRTLTLYRGATTVGQTGMSWTTDRGTAEWFAKRTQFMFPHGESEDDTPRLFMTKVPRRYVLGMFHSVARSEHEVVIHPYWFEDLACEVTELPFSGVARHA